MANLVGVLISGKVFKKGKIAELNRAARAFDIYLTLQASGLIDELEVELQSYNEGNISAYRKTKSSVASCTLAKRLYQNGILDKAFGWESRGFPKEKGDKVRQMDKNVDSARTFAFALIASGLLLPESTASRRPETETVGLIWAFSSLDLFLAIKEEGHESLSGKLSELHGFIENYKKGKIDVQAFVKELLFCGILSALQDCGYEYDSINSVVLALVVGGILPEEDRVELSRYTGHLDLYRWLEKKGFLNEQRGLIEAYKSGKINEHAFISKLHQSGILSKIKAHESLEDTKKDVDSIATLAWAIAIGEDIPQSKFVPLGWEASTFDLYRDMQTTTHDFVLAERNGFIEELRPLAEAYNSGKGAGLSAEGVSKPSKYAFVRQLHQTSILSKIQESGREVFSYVTLTNALVSGGLIPYDRKTALNWLSNSFDIFIELTEDVLGGKVGASLRVGKSGFCEAKGRHSEGRGDKHISAYIQDYCDTLSARIEGKEVTPALYALHISLLHDSVNQILKRNGRDINTSTFFHVLISGGIIDESLEFLISCAIGALNRAEALALRELYKSSSSFANFYRKMVDNWHSLREDLQSTYTKGAPPEKPFSNSYAWKIWSALSAVNGLG